MAIPVVKGSKKEVVGIGDLKSELNLAAWKEQVDCSFTCDKGFLLTNENSSFEVNLEDSSVETLSKLTNDYAVGAYVTVSPSIGDKYDVVILAVPESSDYSSVTAILLKRGGVGNYKLVIPTYYGEFNQIIYENKHWQYFLIKENKELGVEEISPLNIPRCSIDSDGSIDDMVCKFLETIHAKVRE